MNNINLSESIDAQTLKLRQDEELLYSSDFAMLTNRRILVPNIGNKRAPQLLSDWQEAPIAESMPPQLKNGGKQVKREFGTRLTLIGAGLVLIQILPFYVIDQNLVGILGRFFEVIYFLVSMFCLTVGVYFAAGSYLTRGPHTTALFVLPGGKDLIALFPGWDSEEAEKMGRIYRRLRRTL